MSADRRCDKVNVKVCAYALIHAQYRKYISWKEIGWKISISQSLIMMTFVKLS